MSSDDDSARQAELARQLELVRSDPEAAAAIAATLVFDPPDAATSGAPDGLPAAVVPEPEPEPELAPEIDDEQQRIMLLQQKLEQVRADPDAAVDTLAELPGPAEEAIPDEAASEQERRAQLEKRLAEARSSEVRAAEIELEVAEAHSADKTAAQPTAGSPAARLGDQSTVSPDPSLPPSTTPSEQAPTDRTVQAQRKRKPGLFACCGTR